MLLKDWGNYQNQRSKCEKEPNRLSRNGKICNNKIENLSELDTVGEGINELEENTLNLE
jgi:hypothetical protein